MKKTILGALIAAAILALWGGAARAAGEAVEAHQQSWTFAGIFGTYDRNQLQRGFQVYRQACSSCHGLDFISFRNFGEPGGPAYSEAAVRALAAEYTIVDPEAEGGSRPGIPADRWPAPFPSDRAARDANNGIVPPDLSLMAKARTIHQEFPWWVFNYFTAYQEGGADYIYNLLTRYTDPPPDVELQPGQYYNEFFPDHFIAMPPPLFDGAIRYDGDGIVPETVEQYAYDVAAFLQWTADPHMVARKQTGFRVLIVLIALATLMYLVKRKIWREAH